MLKRFGFPTIMWAADGGSGAASSAPSGGSPAGSSSSTGSDGAGAGGSASPSPPQATPSQAPAPSTSSGEPSSQLDFDLFFGGGEPAPEVSEAAPMVAPPVTPSQPAPVQPPVAAEAPKPVAPVQAEEVTTQAPQASEAPQRPRLDPADPMSIATALQMEEAAAVEHVANAMFALSADDVEALETDVVGTIPKLLARGFVKSQQNFLTQMGRFIPLMIERHAVMMQRNSENEAKFFARWPDLKQAEHLGVVRQYAVAYRRMHPQATMEQMMEDLGPMVMMAARVVPSAHAPPKGNGASPNGAQRAVSSPPFVPAQGGPAASVTQVEGQAWDILDPTVERS